MSILVIMGAVMAAWVLQTILGAGQLKDFNKNYSAMREEGKVSIGRSKGVVRTGVVLLMGIDNRHRIKRAKKMQGLTIFAKFKDYSVLEGQDLLSVDPEIYEKMDRFTQKAFDDAVDVYRKVAKGEEIPKRKSPFGKLISGISK